MLKNYFGWIVRHRSAVVIMWIVLTIYIVFFAKNLRVVVDSDSILPPDHPYTIGGHQITDNFDLKYSLIIGITPPSGDVYQPNVVKAIKEISSALAKTDYVIPHRISSFAGDKVKSIDADGDTIFIHQLLDQYSGMPEQLAQVKRQVENTEIFQQTLVSDDKKTAAIIAEYNANPLGFRNTLDQVESIVAQYREDLTISYGGHMAMMSATEKFSDRMAILLPAAILIIGAILYFAFGHFQALMMPLTTGLLAVAITLGLMGLLNIPLDVFNAITPILILAVVTGHSSQILKRYFEEHAQGYSHHEAIVRTLITMTPITLSAGIAAICGFLSLLVFQIKSIWVFGLMTGLGLFIGLLLEFSFVPALRAMIKAPKKTHKTKFLLFLENVAINIYLKLKQNTKLFVSCLAVIFIVCIWSATLVKVDNSNKNNIAESHPVRIQDAFLNQHFAGTNSIYIGIDTLKTDQVKTTATVALLNDIQKVASKYPFVGKSVSLADHIKRLNKAFHEDDPRFYTIPNTNEGVAELLTLYSFSGDSNDFDMFVDKNFQKASVLIYLKTDSSELVNPLLDEIKSVVGNKAVLYIGGSVPEAIGISEVMIKEKLLNLMQITCIVFVVAYFVFRSLAISFLVVLPIASAVLFNFSMMGALGIALNTPTSLCSAIAVGIGADFAIYLIYRIKQLMVNHSLDQAIIIGLQTAGSTCILVAFAIALGYSVLLFSSDFYPHIWMSLLIGCAMIVGVLITITIPPLCIAKSIYLQNQLKSKSI